MRRTLLVVAALTALVGCGDDKAQPYDVTQPATVAPQAGLAPLTIEQSANGTTVEATAGQRVLVRLPQDPASIQQWEQINDEPGAVVADGGPTSEGGTVVWPFRTVERGVTMLEFTYGPGGQLSVDPDPTFVVEVRVS
ncbi:hypothetical protein [Nocardia sp. NPDC058666]|uniref:hypothetical protein n=1 Tax=Nocardia sp. NPDC058666 TaxID=3346587 RepID=UPI00365ADB39